MMKQNAANVARLIALSRRLRDYMSGNLKFSGFKIVTSAIVRTEEGIKKYHVRSVADARRRFSEIVRYEIAVYNESNAFDLRKISVDLKLKNPTVMSRKESGSYHFFAKNSVSAEDMICAIASARG